MFTFDIPAPDDANSFKVDLGFTQETGVKSEEEINDLIKLINTKFEKLKLLIEKFNQSRSLKLIIPTYIRGDFDNPSIQDITESIKGLINQIIQVDSDQKKESLLQQLNEMGSISLTNEEKKAVGAIKDLSGHIQKIEWASNNESQDKHKEEISDFFNLLEEFTNNFNNPKLWSEILSIVMSIPTSHGSVRESMTYHKHEIDASEDQRRRNIEEKGLQYALPSSGNIVFYHRTEWYPEKFFDKGLGFGIDITSTATLHYYNGNIKKMKTELLEALASRYKKNSVYVIICELPAEAYIRDPDHECNVSSEFLTSPLGIGNASTGKFDHAIDPKYIKGAVNQLTGEFIPNPKWTEFQK